VELSRLATVAAGSGQSVTTTVRANAGGHALLTDNDAGGTFSVTTPAPALRWHLIRRQ
jgi:hypothetical protein